MPSQPAVPSAATILLVDDDPVLRETLAYNLRRAEYHVLTASDGETGLQLARQAGRQLDLLILDLMLPRLDGFQVLRHLRTFSNAPVLILSARGEEQDKIDGLELGADDYITKPFALQEFLARVRAALRRQALPAARPPGMLSRGPLVILPSYHRVTVAGQELSLRPKEFELLVTLAMAPGHVFRRQELLDCVWGKEIVVDPRTVDVHISWLRGKLVKAGLEQGLITTVYGVGYQFHFSHDADTQPVTTTVDG